jgi:trehalose 6-phosphate phosphatase
VPAPPPPKAEPGFDLLEGLRARPDRSGVLSDFDGTLSAIVADPAAARPLDRVPAVLERLAARYAVVAIVSGRPVAFLEAHLPASVRMSGLYGLERSEGGVRSEPDGAGPWREVVADVATAAEAHGPPGMTVERKGLSMTLHFRSHPDLAGPVTEWAAQQASRSGLTVRPAKMSVELHPPVPVDKGTAVEALAGGLDAVCYIGDDIGDLPAFDALDRLAAAGAATVRVGVRSAEAPAAVLERADVVVDGPAGAVALLAHLGA